MKAGVIDIFADSFGWVLGKTCLFALAVATGVGIGWCALRAGCAAGGGGLDFRTGPNPVHGHLAVVTAILPQVLVIFWAGMAFVRSENAETRHWVMIVALEALLLTACFARAIPGGWAGQAAAWMMAVSLVAAVVLTVRAGERKMMARGADHLERLKAANVVRREELKRKYGTDSAGAEDLEIL